MSILKPWWRRWLAYWTDRPTCRVRYQDGQWSMPMPLYQAKDMASIFRGEVRWSEEFRSPGSDGDV